MADIHSRCFSRPWSAADLRRLSEAPHCFGIAALCGDMLAGFILISAAADQTEILTLAVDTAWRRQGIGAALLEAAVSQAGHRGATAMLLEVGVLNAPAQALYSGAGFTVIGRRRNYYRGPGGAEDAFVMRRDIPPRPA